MRIRTRVIIVLSVVGLAAVAFVFAAHSSIAEVAHPTRENILPDAEISSLIGSSSTLGGWVGTIITRLQRATRATEEFGTAAGLSSFADAVVNPHGQLIVLDPKAGKVWLDPFHGIADAVPTVPLGIDLHHAKRLTFDAEGRLTMAFDNQSLALFEPDSNRYRFVRAASTAGTLEDLCGAGSSLYARFPGNSRLVTSYDRDRRVLASFGEPYKAKDSEIRERLSQGLIACHLNGTTIAAIFHMFPYMYGFNVAGQTLWLSKFTDFKISRLIERQEIHHSHLIHTQVEYVNRFVSLITAGDEAFLVQVLWGGPDPATHKYDLHTYIVDADSGRGAYIGKHLPQLIAGTDSLLYGIERNPLRIVMYRF